MEQERIDGLDVVVHRTFESARPVWLDVEARGAAFVFQSFDWCATWFETVGRFLRVEPVLVHVRDPGSGAEMFLPLGVQPNRFRVRALGFLDGRLADHAAPVLAGPAGSAFEAGAMVVLLRRIGKALKADVLDLKHLRAVVDDAPNPLIGAHAEPASYATHGVRLAGPRESLAVGRLSAGHQAGNRRRLRRLEAQGKPRFLIAETLEQALAILESTLAQKSQQNRDTGRPNPLALPAYREFYVRMTREHHGSGLVHLAALYLDDRPLATHWGCVYKGRFVWLMPSYDQAWSKASPGRLLLDHLVEWSWRRGLREFDFTIGDELYKLAYSGFSEPLYRQVTPWSPLGWAYWMKSRLEARRTRAGSARGAAGPAAAVA